MKKAILRNVIIVTAIFIVTFTIMLVTNYFQVRGVNPLQMDVVETLKEINDANANNPVLQEQIRQLDLLARRAYFVRMDHLMSGVYILLGMLAVFIVTLRFYYAETKHIPDKDIDPIDEWAIKTQARKYIHWGAAGIAAVALLFVGLTSPYLGSRAEAGEEEAPVLALAEDVVMDMDEEYAMGGAPAEDPEAEDDTVQEQPEAAESEEAAAGEAATEAPPQQSRKCPG